MVYREENLPNRPAIDNGVVDTKHNDGANNSGDDVDHKSRAGLVYDFADDEGRSKTEYQLYDKGHRNTPYQGHSDEASSSVLFASSGIFGLSGDFFTDRLVAGL